MLEAPTTMTTLALRQPQHNDSNADNSMLEAPTTVTTLATATSSAH